MESPHQRRPRIFWKLFQLERPSLSRLAAVAGGGTRSVAGAGAGAVEDGGAGGGAGAGCQREFV